MNKQTERLRERIADSHYRSNGRGLKEFIDLPVYLQNIYLAIADDDLEICQEAGLKFVDFPKDPEGCSICKVEEIDV